MPKPCGRVTDPAADGASPFEAVTRPMTDAPFDELRTVGDVMDLYARRRLCEIRGLGRRRAFEIEAAVVLAGLNLAGHQHQPASSEGDAK